jgi:hypothetical protein
VCREKAHTREGDALAAARRRLPMVELAHLDGGRDSTAAAHPPSPGTTRWR